MRKKSTNKQGHPFTAEEIREVWEKAEIIYSLKS